MPLNFQQVILNLQQFWAERGCVLWQPYYTQVGAGTMKPVSSGSRIRCWVAEDGCELAS